MKLASLSFPEHAQHKGQPIKKTQFSLRSVLLAIAVLCTLLALLFSQNAVVRLVAICVIAANSFGLIAGLFVTYVLGFPRDGHHRHLDEDET